MEKPCICCGVTKPIAEFYAHKMMSDGHLNKRKDCVKAAVKARRQDPATREHVLAWKAMLWAAECIARKYGTEGCEGCHDRDEEIDRLKDALRMAADEPNIDKARKIADAVLMPNAEVTGGPLSARPVDCRVSRHAATTDF